MNWCDQHKKLSTLYDLIYVGGLTTLLCIMIYRRQQFVSFYETHTKHSRLLNKTENNLANPRDIPIKIKVVIMYVMLVVQFINSLVSMIIWMAGTTTCYTFGLQYMMESIVWSTMIGVFWFENKFTTQITRASQAVYTCQFIIHVISFLILLIFVDEQELKDQMVRQVFGLTSSGAILFISMKLPLLRLYDKYEDDSTEDQRISLQDNNNLEKSKVVIISDKNKPVQEEIDIKTLWNKGQSQKPIYTNSSQYEVSGSFDLLQPYEQQTFNWHQTNTQQPNLHQQQPDPHQQQSNSIENHNDKVDVQTAQLPVKEIEILPDQHIQSVKVDGYQEIKKFGKKTLVYHIHTKFREQDKLVYSERSYREFRTLYKSITKTFPKLKHPQFPDTKGTSGYLTKKDLRERSDNFETILKYWVSEDMKNDQLDTFLHPEESNNTNKSSMSSNSQVSSQQSFNSSQQSFNSVVGQEEIYQNNSQPSSHFDILIKNRQNIKKAIRSMNQQDDNKPASDEEGVQSLENSQIEVNNEFEFEIKEMKKKDGVQYYKIDSLFQKRVVATVLHRYKEFKALHKYLQDQLLTTITLPDQPAQGQDINEFRREKLMQYLNQIYDNPQIRIQMKFKEFLGI